MNSGKSTKTVLDAYVIKRGRLFINHAGGGGAVNIRRSLCENIHARARRQIITARASDVTDSSRARSIYWSADRRRRREERTYVTDGVACNNRDSPIAVVARYY